MIEALDMNYGMVLIKPEKTETETKSGITIPEELRRRPAKGTVISVGEGTKDRPMKIVVGAIVFHVKDAGHEIEDEEGNKYYIMPDKDCLCQMQPVEKLGTNMIHYYQTGQIIENERIMGYNR